MKKFLNDFKTILIPLILLGLFIIVILNLYNINIEIIIYISVIYYLGIFLICLFAFKRYKKILNQLDNYSLFQSTLPKENNEINQLYNDIIQQYIDEYKAIKQKYLIQNNETNDFFALWTHQIKTPIAAMNLLLQASDCPNNKDMQSSLFAIDQYVELILQYLKSEDLNQDLVLTKYNLDDIIKDAIKKYANIFITKNIQLNYKETNIDVLTDKKWLTFIIEQLLSNALKYTNEGSITIYLENNQLIIKDTGIGINESDIPRIFDKGYTGYNGRMFQKSSGIGLYLVKKMITKLQSDIKIESQTDVGTIVIIDIAKLT